MYKFDNDFYSRVKNKMGNNWKNMFIAFLIVGIISSVLSSSATLPRTYGSLYYYMYHHNSSSILNTVISRGFNFNSLVSSVITGIFNLIFNMEVYNFVKTDSFELGNIFNYIKENPSNVLIVGALKGLIDFLLGLIPVVGFILVIFAQLGFTYIAYIMYLNPKKEVMDYFRDSWNLTNGKKQQLFSILIHYMLITIVGVGFIIFGIIIIFIGGLSDFYLLAYFGLLLFFVGIIWIVVWALKNSPYLALANAMFFDEHMEYENVVI